MTEGHKLLLSEFEERLSDVPRWTIVRTIQRQSVAEHSFRVALIASRLVVHFFSQNWWQEARNKVVAVALLHDQAEAFTGDIPTPAGQRIDKCGLEDHFVGRYLDNPQASETVAQVVKVADMVEALVFLACEISMGNESVRRIYETIEDKLCGFLGDIGKVDIIPLVALTYEQFLGQLQDPLEP